MPLGEVDCWLEIDSGATKELPLIDDVVESIVSIVLAGDNERPDKSLVMFFVRPLPPLLTLAFLVEGP